ncbi:MAG TPA: hypothetical protein IAA30_00240 [Candidatus Treponema faecavium]|nr:hypothetical protein [Candidatus Treponema faecavium]
MNSLSAYSYSAAGLSASGKLYVPVQPAMVIYTQFEHVAGYADSSNPSAGVPINKIHILNSLIDQLVSMKQQPAAVKQITNTDDAQLDALIETYETQLQSALAAAQANPFLLSGARPQTGAVFSILT